MNKNYVKIEGVTGPVKVKSYEGFFEVNELDAGPIVNAYNGTNNTGAFSGVPQLSTLKMVLEHCPGEVSSTLQTNVLNAIPLKSVEIHQITKLNKEETTTHKMVYTEPHIFNYDLNPASKSLFLELGNMTNVEITHYNVDNDGSVKPFVVKYDLTKHEAS